MVMPTPLLGRDLRERIVAHYSSVKGATYRSTAAHFAVGVATVNRILRVKRETGDVVPVPREKRRKNKVDLKWLEAHARAEPDARLKDRAAAYTAETGVSVSLVAVFNGLQVLGFSHKKKRFLPRRETASGSTS